VHAEKMLAELVTFISRAVPGTATALRDSRLIFEQVTTIRK